MQTQCLFTYYLFTYVLEHKMAVEDLYKCFTGIFFPNCVNMLDSLADTRWSMEVCL
jgi:hypothetical protein